MSFQKITKLERSGILKLVDQTLNQHLDTDFALRVFSAHFKDGKKHT